MATTKEKKNFADAMAISHRPDKEAEGLDALFPSTIREPIAEPHKRRPNNKATHDGRVAVTFNLPVDLIEQLRAMAYWSRCEQWQIVADGVAKCISDYETENGPMGPIPTR